MARSVKRRLPYYIILHVSQMFMQLHSLTIVFYDAVAEPVPRAFEMRLVNEVIN